MLILNISGVYPKQISFTNVLDEFRLVICNKKLTIFYLM